jgi:repressor LexA
VDRKTTPRQQAILDVIKDFTREHGYPPSVREIGERVGLSSSSTVQCHLRTLEKKGLIKRDPTKPRALTSESDSIARNVVTVPLIGKVAAGLPITAAENIEDEFALPASFVRNSGSFMLRVQGDSMVEAAILHGDLILVNPQKVANNGEIVVAMIENEATVKTFYKEENRVRLQPQNKFMEPIYTDTVDIVGKVSAVIRRL